jgi:hypothetical protein
MEKLATSGAVEVEYQSVDGPTVTHIRGSVLTASLENLRSANLYELYLSHLPSEQVAQITYSIAASWISVELAMAHCRALDAMGFSATTITQQGQQVGSSWGRMLYSTVLKTTRSLGGDVGWLVLRQSGRLMQRVYRGGGCTVLRVGPKDALFELHGLPLIRSPYFRAAHHASMRAVAQLLGGGSYVRPAQPRQAHPQRIATSFSWV